MENFLNFLRSTNHLLYVISSYLIVFLIMIIIFILSLKRTKKLEELFDRLNKK